MTLEWQWLKTAVLLSHVRDTHALRPPDLDHVKALQVGYLRRDPIPPMKVMPAEQEGFFDRIGGQHRHLAMIKAGFQEAEVLCASMRLPPEIAQAEALTDIRYRRVEALPFITRIPYQDKLPTLSLSVSPCPASEGDGTRTRNHRIDSSVSWSPVSACHKRR
jgi:hypothetical protein